MDNAVGGWADCQEAVVGGGDSFGCASVEFPWVLIIEVVREGDMVVVGGVQVLIKVAVPGHELWRISDWIILVSFE